MNELEMKAELERSSGRKCPTQDEGKGRHHPEGERKRRGITLRDGEVPSHFVRASGSASSPVRLKLRHLFARRLCACAALPL
jgi:hypothetical protein